MLNKEKVESMINRELRSRVGRIHFVKTSIDARPWFFDGINYVIRKGEKDREVYITMGKGSIKIVGDKVEPDDVLIPQSSINLYIFTPVLEVGKITVAELLDEIIDSMDNNRDVILSNILKESAKETDNANDFIDTFRGKLADVGEDKLADKPIEDLFVEIGAILDINEKDGYVTKIRSQISLSGYEIVFYEDRDEVMRHAFSLTDSGLYGFANYLNIMSQTVICKKPEGASSQYLNEGKLMPS